MDVPCDSTLSHTLSYHREAGDQLAVEATLYNLSYLRWLDMFLCEQVFLLCTILNSRMKSKSGIKVLINYSPSSINGLTGGKIHHSPLIGCSGSLFDLLIWVG